MSLYNILGNISFSTTVSARSIVCLAIFAKQEHTYLLSCASACTIKELKNGTAPASTTYYAKSLECLQISESAEAAILFKATSGS